MKYGAALVPIADVAASLNTEYGGSLVDYLGDDDPGDDADAWLIHGIVAAGVPQMTAGHPKSHKTFLMEHIAITIAAGVSWLGHFATRRGRVLVLPREDSERETRRRFWRLARGLGLDPRSLDGWLRVDSTRPFYWQDDEQVMQLQRTIDRWKPSLIVIDSLSRTHLGDENSVKEMAVVTNRWSDICQQTGVAISMIHHFTKTGQGTLLQQLRGSGNIGATLRHLVGVDKPLVHGRPFELSFDGNLTPLLPPFQVAMRDATDRAGKSTIVFEYGGTAASQREREAQDLIRAVLAGAGEAGLSANQLARECRAGTGRARTEHNARRDALLASDWDHATPENIVCASGRYYRSPAAMRGIAG